MFNMPGITGAPVGTGSGSMGNTFLNTAEGIMPGIAQFADAILQGANNRKNRKFAIDMYNRQRSDALADWNAQNLYNSPAEQMKRLKEAGLNPHLVYGTGANALEAAPVRSSSPQSYHGEAPQVAPGLAQGLQFATQQAILRQQLDNLKATKAYILSNTLNKNADTGLKDVNANSAGFDLGLKSDLRETNIAIKEQMLQNLGLTGREISANVGNKLLGFDFGQATYGDRAALIGQNLTNAKQLNVLRQAANDRQENLSISLLKIRAQQVLNMAKDNEVNQQRKIYLQKLIMKVDKEKDILGLDYLMKSGGFNWTDPVLLRELRMGFPNH